jgi:hypothetical protein
MVNKPCAICSEDTEVVGIRYATMDSSHMCTYYCQKCVQADERVVVKKVCSHCDHEVAEKIKFDVVKKEVPEEHQIRITKGGGTPDVWYGYGSGIHSEENIADPVTGEPIPFWDKTSKREAMRRAGVREAGDKVHGARNDDMTPGKRKKYFV